MKLTTAWFLIVGVLYLGILFQTSRGNFLPVIPADDDVPRQNRHGIPFRNRTRSQTLVGLDTDSPEAGLPFARVNRPDVCTEPSDKCAPIPAGVTSYLQTIAVILDYNYMVASPEAETLSLLRAISGLKHHEKCWPVAQPVLYGIALPKCGNVTKEKRMIPVDQCLGVQEACGPVVINALPPALSILKTCDDWSVFTNNSDCEREISWFDGLESNISFTCPFPLKATRDPIKQKFDNGVCGLQCQDPFLNERQRHNLNIYVAVLVGLSLFLNGTAFLLLVRKWRTLKHYPDQCVLFVNVCFIMSAIGWFIQFVPGARDNVACAEDGTERLNEPRYEYGEGHYLCLVTFFLVYYFMMAAALWFVIISYFWYRSFRALMSNEIKVKSLLHTIGFHVFAWVTPLVMSLIVMATSGIDGNHTTGVCFIGIRWVLIRVFLLVVPLVCVAFASCFFMTKGLILLYRLRTHRDQSLSVSDKNNIRSTMLHIGFIAVVVCICIFTSLFIHVHYYIYQNDYAEQRKAFVECHLGNAIRGDTVSICEGQTTMDYETIELGAHLALQFLAGIVFSTWVWRQRHNHLRHLVKLMKRKFGRKVSNAVTIRRKGTSGTLPPDTIDNGTVNVGFIPDRSTEAPPREAPTFRISVDNSCDALYDVVIFNTREGSAPVDNESRDFDESPVDYSEDRLQNWHTTVQEATPERPKNLSVSSPPSPVDSLSPRGMGSREDSLDGFPEEDRLQNWQGRANELRRERRKKSSDVSFGSSPSRDDSVATGRSRDADSVDEFPANRSRPGKRKKTSVGSFFSRDDTLHEVEPPPLVDGVPEEPENRLENWQDRAREIRTERRKKSSVTSSGPPPRSRSSENFAPLNDSVHVIMDPTPSPTPVKRQRRPGRVEFFKQSDPRSARVSPVRSISQNDFAQPEEYVHFAPSPRAQLPPKPGRKISRIRALSPLEQSTANRFSPDEGIEMEQLGPDRGSLSAPLPDLVFNYAHVGKRPDSPLQLDSSNA